MTQGFDAAQFYNLFGPSAIAATHQQQYDRLKSRTYTSSIVWTELKTTVRFYPGGTKAGLNRLMTCDANASVSAG